MNFAVLTVMSRNYPFNLHRKLLSQSRVRDNPTAKYANVNYAFGERTSYALQCWDAPMLGCSDASMQMQMLLPLLLTTCQHLVATADNDAWRQIMLIAWMMEGFEREYEFCDRLGSQSRMQNPEPAWLKACKLFEASGICAEWHPNGCTYRRCHWPESSMQPPRWMDGLCMWIVRFGSKRIGVAPHCACVHLSWPRSAACGVTFVSD